MASVGRPRQDKYWARQVGLWIRAQREQVLGMSQEDVADLVNVTRTTVNKWESGRVSAPISKVVMIFGLVQKALDGVQEKERLKIELERLETLGIEEFIIDILESIRGRKEIAAAATEVPPAADPPPTVQS